MHSSLSGLWTGNGLGVPCGSWGHVFTQGGSGLHFSTTHTDHHTVTGFRAWPRPTMPSMTPVACRLNPLCLSAPGQRMVLYLGGHSVEYTGGFLLCPLKGQWWLHGEDENAESTFHLSWSTGWVCHLGEQQQQQKHSEIKMFRGKKNLRTLWRMRSEA